ncbi:hypothetical protein BLA50215_04991 [Burkholderia lata]|nr:hypothetical protein BLA50215_04991 [Burkholderia lata]
MTIHAAPSIITDRSPGRPAKPGCNDVTSTAAELGKEGLRGRWMVRETV